MTEGTKKDKLHLELESQKENISSHTNNSVHITSVNCFYTHVNIRLGNLYYLKVISTTLKLVLLNATPWW